MHESFLRESVLILAGHSFTGADAVLAGAVLSAVLGLFLIATLMRASNRRAAEAATAAERARELEDRLAELARLQAELTGRVGAVADVLGSGQGELARLMGERMDQVRSAMSSGLAEGAQRTAETLGKLHERLAVIDAAQADLKGLTSEVLTLKDVLANKPARGAFGQGRMEAIVRDGLPPDAFAFQAVLPNNSRPDCLLTLPGDERPLVIDAKFPLEGFVALREARDDAARMMAERRVRADVGQHVKDIAGKYLIAGETQDFALLFVPSEAIYADLAERFEDVVIKSHRARVLIVSPSLLMMAIQVCLAIVRDHRVRDQARVIQSEVGKLLEDVRRLKERAGKLESHFRQAQEDVTGLLVSADKIDRRGERIEGLDFSDAEPTASVAAPAPRRAVAG